jgi:hypothetical protein
MLVKKTFLGVSTIHGIGVFADEPIKEGETVWVPGFESIYRSDTLDTLDLRIQKFLRHHAYYNVEDDCWHLPLDNDRFINHSVTPNIKNGIVLTNIAYGEELTEDYREWDKSFETREI